VGIPAGKLDSIFDMFTQVDSSSRRSQGGLGIGLALVKRLVQLHGGSVEARSAGERQGSTFEVRLPVAVASDERTTLPEVPPPVAEATPSRRILVVDDNQDAASVLAQLLEMGGHEVDTAHDGAEALETAGRQHPDVVLLDIGLPTLNGYEVCRRIRERPWGKKTIVIALSGWGQEGDRQLSREAGFDGHLVKPVDYPELLALLGSLTEARRAG
jgi:CheY-like chemotaxis protein